MASQAKDRHSAQLARSLTEFNQTIVQTKTLLNQFSADLDAMRTLTAIHVSQYASPVYIVWSRNENGFFYRFMTVATDVDTRARRNEHESDHGR